MELPTDKRIPLVQAVPLLNSASAELTAVNLEVSITYELYQNQSDEHFLLEAVLVLPITQGTTIEAIQHPIVDSNDYSFEEKEQFLALFGKQNKRKNVSAKNATKTQKDTQESKKEKKSKSGKKWQYLLLIPILFLVCIVGLITSQVYLNQSRQTNISTNELKKKVEELETTVEVSGKLDTFSRFFITNLLSGVTDEIAFQDQVKKYIDKEVLKDVSPTEDKIKSILPWETKRDGNNWKLSYVITTEDKTKKAQMEKISFTIAPNEKGFQVVSVPERESFSIN